MGRAYIDTLAEYGRALELPSSQGWLLGRRIPGHDDEDACGAYPLFSCRYWDRLADDLAALEGRLTSCVLVTDPFGDYTQEDLRAAFPDMVRPFKSHYIIDFSTPLEKTVRSRHRTYSRKAMRDYTVALCDEPLRLLERWNRLYGILIERHQVTGMATFSPASFRQQFQLPGLRVFYAEREGVIEGIQLWLCRDDVAYYHLGAYSEAGYTSRVSYALTWSALQWFEAAGTRRADLGGGAGVNDREDGLTRFKRGWSNTSQVVYLCGRILDKRRYVALVDGAIIPDTGFFPRYRSVEQQVAV